MLNRAALILRYKQPFVDWINAADPSPSSHPLTLAEANQEHTVYLVEVEDEEWLAAWLARHHQELFEKELNGWYTDPALWPRDRSLKTLKRWVLIRAPHRRGGDRWVSTGRRRVPRMSRAGQHATGGWGFRPPQARTGGLTT